MSLQQKAELNFSFAIFSMIVFNIMCDTLFSQWLEALKESKPNACGSHPRYRTFYLRAALYAN
jgi:hypothetical protein